MDPHVSGRPEYTAEGGGKHTLADIAARTRKHDRMQFSHISTLISSGSEDTRRGFDREPDSFRLSSEAQTETRTHGRSSDSFPSRRLPDLDQWQRMPGRTVPCAGRNSQQRKLSPTFTAFPFHRAAPHGGGLRTIARTKVMFCLEIPSPEPHPKRRSRTGAVRPETGQACRTSQKPAESGGETSELHGEADGRHQRAADLPDILHPVALLRNRSGGILHDARTHQHIRLAELATRDVLQVEVDTQHTASSRPRLYCE